MTKINRVLTKESSRENAIKEILKATHIYKESQCGAVVEQKNITMKDMGSPPPWCQFDFDSFVGKLTENGRKVGGEWSES